MKSPLAIIVAHAIDGYNRHALINTAIDQLGFCSISATMGELRKEGNIETVGYLNALAEKYGNSIENFMEDFTTPPLDGYTPETLQEADAAQLFGAWKAMLISQSKSQLAEKYPPRTPGKLLDGMFTATAEKEAEVKATTKTFLTQIEIDAGLDPDLLARGSTRRQEQLAKFEAKHQESMRDRINKAFDDAVPVRFQTAWDDMPVYMQWRMMIALWRQLNRAIGAKREDATAQATYSESNAGAHHDALVECSKEMRLELEEAQATEAKQLELARQLGRLRENHELPARYKPGAHVNSVGTGHAASVEAKAKRAEAMAAGKALGLAQLDLSAYVTAVCDPQLAESLGMTVESIIEEATTAGRLVDWSRMVDSNTPAPRATH